MFVFKTLLLTLLNTAVSAVECMHIMPADKYLRINVNQEVTVNENKTDKNVESE